MTPAWLFCPGDRPERYAKALAAADVVIIDLEDGVDPARRETAREALTAAAGELPPDRVVVRVNPAGTDDHTRDLAVLRDLPVEMIMLAKTEDPAQVAACAPFAVVALVETARGVQRVEEIVAADGCRGVMWGAEDLVVSLGGTASRSSDGRHLDVIRYARSRTLVAAAVASVPALDSVYTALDDLDGLRAEAEDAAASGFAAKVCLHPRQVEVVRAAFRPTDDQLAWARTVVAAADGAGGAIRVEGQMIDEPLLRQARRLLDR